MVLKMTYYGNPILRKKCIPVETITEETRAFIDEMAKAMEAYKGIGIAAPQVGSNLRIFLTQVPTYNEEEDEEVAPGVLKVFINPEILEYSDEKSSITEGCLSIPKVHGVVERPLRVKIKAFDGEGREFIEEFEGLHAHCVMHENDHINGVLFIDRMDKKERKNIDQQLKQIKKNYNTK